MSVGHLIAGTLIALVGLAIVAGVGWTIYKEIELPGAFTGKHDKSELTGSGALGFGVLGLVVFCAGVIYATRAASEDQNASTTSTANPVPSSARPSSRPSPTAGTSPIPELPPPGPGPWAASSNGVRVIVVSATVGSNGLDRLDVRVENDGGFKVTLDEADISAVDGRGRSVYFSDELSSLLDVTSAIGGLTLTPGRSTRGTLVTINPVPADVSTLEVRLDINFNGTYVHFPVRTAVERPP